MVAIDLSPYAGICNSKVPELAWLAREARIRVRIGFRVMIRLGLVSRVSQYR